VANKGILRKRSAFLKIFNLYRFLFVYQYCALSGASILLLLLNFWRSKLVVVRLLVIGYVDSLRVSVAEFIYTLLVTLGNSSLIHIALVRKYSSGQK
jgi:ABC-type iron transport system FetAB permease component